MHRSPRKRFAWLVAVGIVFAPRGAAQLGHVVAAQKISDTAGGFTALLDEEDQFGRSIVNLGDVDGDGVTDLLVGAHTDDDGGEDKGSVYVLFLHPNGFVKSWTKIGDLSGNFSGWLDPGDQFGRAAASVGDLDLDGVVDVVVSSNYDDDGGANRGAVYVLFLNPDGTVKTSQKISQLSGGLPVGFRNHDEFGRSITNLGDMDGDGVPDIVVGTPEDDEGGTNTGALHVLFLKRDGTVKSYRRISKFTDGLLLKAGDWFGFCSTSLGDFDGDGVTDIAVGSVLDDDGGFNQGSVWILLLNANGSVKSAQEINELVGGFTAQLDDIDQFGTSIANIGDLDGDGVVDLVVGAVKDDDGGMVDNPDADVGAAYVLFLNPDATVKSWVKISDTTGDMPYDLDQYDWFGSAVARLGGSPNDSRFNAVLGCRNDDDGSPNRGAIYLVQLNDGTAPVADFAASKTLGVAPMTVSFTDLSQNEVSSWLWNLGEGNQSNLRNPTRTYSTPGTYDVQLTVRGPKGKDAERKVGYVTVVTGPLADFTATPTLGTAPLGVQFTNLSEGGVSTWAWDFGDGTTSSEPAPFHVFPAGTFTVSLTVTGPNGAHTKTRADYVVAQDLLPAAGFTHAPGEGFAPLAVQFTDLSTGSITSRTWDFGDGASSSEASPLHTYTTPGVYDVSLTTTGPHGTDVETKLACVVVTSAMPIVGFERAPASGYAPLGVQFTDVSSGNVTARLWDFGDGQTSSATAPFHVYQDAGTYDVRLTITGPGGTDGFTWPAAVEVALPPPSAEFLATSTAGFAPFTVQFNDQSSGDVTARTWLFGDGASSDESDPAHTYTVPGLYAVTLTVVGPSGSDTKSKPDLIHVVDPAPVAGFSAPVTAGSAPLLVSFADESGGDVTSWWWEFGDGGTSAERDPEHAYGLPGVYDVRLTVAGPAGTDSLLRAGFVQASEPPPAVDFAGEPPSGYAPLAVQFTDLTAGAASSWSWSFGDGAGSAERDPAHLYTAPGTYDVGLTATGPGGSDAEVRAGYVTVLDPVPAAAFTAEPTSGVAPIAVQFTDASTGLVTAWSWSFGDGATASTPSPAHVYSAPGTYTVALTASGPAGSDVETRTGFVTVQWPPPVPEYAAGPVTGFAPLSVAFTDLSTGNVTSVFWTFGDRSTSRVRYPVKTYNRPGSYRVTLAATGPGGTASVSHGNVTVLALPVFPDGGFELDTAGTTPRAPWTVFAGTAITVQSSASPDTLFPREGTRWCEIGADGSSAATPPSSPRGAGTPASGAAGIEQRFPFASLAPHLLFDAAFLLGDAASDAARNDFMSVDLSAGAASANVFHADGFSEFALVSSKYGWPMTSPERVHVDLRSLFPGLAEGELVTLRVSVGNGGDALAPSRGYVDSFRLVPAASASFRNGTGRNAPRYTSSPAILGGTWTIQVDTTGHAGARTIQLVGMQRPASGTLRASGELLTGGLKLFSQAWPALPGLNVRTVTLPVDLSLVGRYMATQVTITGGRTELCNAFDLVLGF